MNILKTDYFTLNKKPSKSLDLMICNIGDGDGENMQFGLTREISQANSSINDIKPIQYITNEYKEIEIQFIRMKGHTPLPLTYNYMFDVNRFLHSKNFVPLEFNGFTLNVILKSSSLTQYNKDGVGYITCTFLCEPYMTSSINITKNIQGEHNFDFYNKSNVDDKTNIDYIDINVYKGDYIRFYNLVNGGNFNIEGLSSDTKNIRISVDNLRYVYNPKNENDNIYKFVTKKDWKTFDLMYGRNRFKIECDNCQISMNYKQKIILM